MLKPTVTVEGRTFTNLLEVIVRTGGHVLPKGTTHWGLRSVHRHENSGARTSRNGFAYPEPGNWAQAPGPFNTANADACPSRIGDGLCLATTAISADASIWHGIASARISAAHLLLVAFRAEDVLGSEPETGKVRVRRMFVVADVDGYGLVVTHGTGADLRGVEFEPCHPGYYEGMGTALMYGASYREIRTAGQSRIDSCSYAMARRAGATDAEIHEAHRRPISIEYYAQARSTGATHQNVYDALTVGIPLWEYTWGREVGATHTELLAAFQDGFDLAAYANARSWEMSDARIRAAYRAGINYYDYHHARRAGASDRRVRRAHKANINLRAYSAARRAGASDRQARAVFEAGIDLRAYARARCAGISDRAAHELHRADVDLDKHLAALIGEPPF